MTKSDIEKILNEYSLGNLKDFNLILVGVSSENYRIQTSQGLFFLKKHRKEASKRLKSIERIEHLFNSHGFPIVCPIMNKAGKYYSIHENNYFVVYPFISGKSFKNGQAPLNAFSKLGVLLANIHLLTKGGIKESYADVKVYFMPFNPEQILEYINKHLDRISHLDKKSAYDLQAEKGLFLKRDMITKFAPQFKKISFDKFNLGHGDYHLENIFFDPQQNISAVFDLDMAGPMPRMYELVRSIMISCFAHVYAEDRIIQAEAFIKAYYEKYPFEKDDFKKGMDTFYFKTFSTWRERAHYEESDNRTDDEYPLTIESIKYLNDKRDYLVDRLYVYATSSGY